MRGCCLALMLLSSFSAMLALVMPAQAHPVAHHHKGTSSIGYAVTGTVFDDYNQNGTQDALEPGINGVVVTAYDVNNLVVGTATSASVAGILGQYTINIADGTGAARVQFSNFGSTSTVPALIGYYPSAHGATAGTTVAFVSGLLATNTVNLGIARPSEYSQPNPDIATSDYVQGDQTGVNPVLVRFPYNSTKTAPYTTLAHASQLGTTWGLAYRNSSDSLFAAAFTKQLAAFKPGGTPGDIYLISGADSAAPVVGATPFIELNAGADPHNPAGNYLPDYSAYDAVAKTGIGGLAMSEDNATLYAVNLFDRSLYSIPVGAAPTAPVAGTPTSIPIPQAADCPAADTNFRPFAVTAYDNLIYVGAVCSAETTQSTADLHAYVFSYSPALGVFNSTPVFEVTNMTFARLCFDGASAGYASCHPTYPADWLPWQPDYTIAYNRFGGTDYPTPLLTGITFDNGNLILALRDRLGDEGGHNIPSGLGTNPRTAGDLLRACMNTPGDMTAGWTLENNGSCGGITTAGAGNAGGPGGGEYYYQQQNHVPPLLTSTRLAHDYISVGGVRQLAGFPSVMNSVYDPLSGYFAGGTRLYTNSTGAMQVSGENAQSYQVYSDSEPSRFGKSNGVGSIVAFTQPAPLEIGNRLWLDSNGNGIQDADEPNIAGATVHLYAADGTTLLGTTTTDANGNYYFNASNVTENDTPGIAPYVAHVVAVDNPTDYAVGGPLAGLQLTAAKQGSDASINSKGTLPIAGQPIGSGNYPQIAVGTLVPGQNDDSFDVGFVPAPDMSMSKRATTGHNYQVGQRVVYSLQTSNTNTALGPVVAGNQIVVTDTIPTGFTNLFAAGNGWHVALSSTSSPATLTATYTGTYPVAPGTFLAPIVLTGTLTASAIPGLVNTATVLTAGDSNPNNNTGNTTITVSAAPTPTPTPTPTPVPLPPDVGVTLRPLTPPTLAVGQPATFTGLVCNDGPVAVSQPITVSGVIPKGLANITLMGTGWTINSLSATTSPATYTATYTGSYPVALNTCLPSLLIGGTVTVAGIPMLTTTITVSTPGDSNPNNNVASATVVVMPAVTPTPEPVNVGVTLNPPPTPVVPGQPATFDGRICNLGSVAVTQPISVSGVMPLGLTNVKLTGTGWTVTSLSATTSPATYTATYTGKYPIPAGTCLPPLLVTGIVNVTGISSITTTIMVNTPGNSNAVTTSTTTVVVPPHPIPNVSPDLAIGINTGGNHFREGDTVTANLEVCNLANAGPVVLPYSIVVTYTMPLGLSHIAAYSRGWMMRIDTTTSPAQLTARYVGSYPVYPGMCLTPILVNGQLTHDAVPTFTSMAWVSTPGDSNPTNNVAVATIVVWQLHYQCDDQQQQCDNQRRHHTR